MERGSSPQIFRTESEGLSAAGGTGDGRGFERGLGGDRLGSKCRGQGTAPKATGGDLSQPQLTGIAEDACGAGPEIHLDLLDERLLEEVEVLEGQARAERNAVEGVLRDVAGNARDLRQELVDVAQQRAAA